MTLLGMIFGGAYLVSLLIWRRAGVMGVMVVAAGFNDSAFLNLNGISVTSFYVGSMLYAALTILHFLQHPRATPLRGSAPILLLAYSLLVTLISPGVFEGLPVFSSDLALDTQVDQGLSRLTYSSANLAQAAYLILNIIMLYTIDVGLPKTRRMISAGLTIGTIVALGSSLLKLRGQTWPDAFFRNSQRNYYSVWDVRSSGQFSEPSHLAIYSTIAMGWWLGILLTRKRRVWPALVMLVVAVACFGLSAAGSGYAGAVGLLIGVLLVAFGPRPAGAEDSPVTRRISFIIVLVGIATLSVLPNLIRFANNYTTTKFGSTSFQTRDIANSNAIAVLWSTWGLGAGLGSNRASSLLLMLLGMIGIVGTALFFGVVARALLQGFREVQLLPAFLALCGCISSMVVSVADLSNPMFWLLVAWMWSKSRTPSDPAPHAVSRGFHASV